MRKKDNRNTVDVRVGASLKAWIVSTYGTDCITLSAHSNMWMIVKQNLDLRPKLYTPLEDRDEYISFVLLKNGGDTQAYAAPDKAHPNRQSYQPNTLFRCMISEKGENIIRRFLQNQFRNAFHNYMKGAINNNPELSIVDAITEFLIDSKQPVVDNKTVAMLTKDWYRYRKKNDDEFMIPIFF